VDGIDSDRASIERASEHLAGSGVEDRVTFLVRDAADARLAGRYELVTIFEALHDMSYPVDVLRAARALLAGRGLVFIGDERTEDTFIAPASETERLFYGFSVFHCLPVGMVGAGAAGTGIVFRAERSAATQTTPLLHVRSAADRERLLALLPAAPLARPVSRIQGFERRPPAGRVLQREANF
jgi:hypothetical protein